MNYHDCKLFVGCVSKNVIDATVECADKNNIILGLIPSRRQVDYCGGYVGLTSYELKNHVKSKNIILERDHGGPEQGQEHDNGITSLQSDCSCYDMIHIDPWKIATDFKDGCELTKEYIETCYEKNANIKYEIGTEESIFPYSNEDLRNLIEHLRESLPEKTFDNIVFAVIQSGTSLKENNNTGNYDKSRLISMIEVCNEYNLLSKEHNGDYLPTEVVYQKLDLGLDAINIAPEFGQMETQIYLNEIKNKELFDIFFNICYNSKRWVKWVDKSFDPTKEKEKLINICGHYVLSDTKFLELIKSNVRKDIDMVIKNKLINRIKELCRI